MMHTRSRAAAIAVVAAAALGATALTATTSMAQTPAQAQTRSLPTFAVDPSWPKVPPQWKLGDVSSMASDAQGNIWVLHRPRTLKGDDFAKAAPPVMVFDQAGNYVKSWGGDGPGYDWPQREHGIYIDSKGFVWLGGNNCPENGLARLKPVADDALLKFTQDGKFVMQIGHSNQSKGNADTTNVHRAADVQLYPPTNELFVADGYGNHRVIVFDADTGAFKRMWGAFGNKPKDDDHCEIVRKTDFTPPGPPQFSVVHSLRVANDGLVYVADRENHRVQMFSNDGKFLKQNLKGNTLFARSVALSPDQEQQFLYVGDGKEIAILDRKSLDQIGTIKVPGLIGGGHLISTDAKGNIYVAATGQGLQRLNFQGMSATASR
jgi:DNA-binding beta-propeller fold protein YncE